MTRSLRPQPPVGRLRGARLRAGAGVAAIAVLLCLLVGCDSGSDSSSQSASSVQGDFVDVVKRVSPQVVQIQTPGGLGSGVVFDGNGDVVTNAHVVGRFDRFLVTLSGSARDEATLVGSFPEGDIAVVRLASARPHPATFGDSSKTKVGELALAIGNPLGLRSSVTDGIVSSVGRTVSEGRGVSIPSAVQTSAPINPGNSGGALVDIDGRVIGIPTLAATDPEFGGAPAPGIGFAIPSNTVRSVASRLISSGRMSRAQRASLGVVVATPVGGGVLVRAVEPGGPADRAGIRPGDVIVAVNGQATSTTEDLVSLLATLRPGQKVSVSLIRRDGSRATVSVTLGT